MMTVNFSDTLRKLLTASGKRGQQPAETLKYRETVTMALRKFMMLRMRILTS